MDLSRRQLFTTLGAGAIAASVPVRTTARTETSARAGDPSDFAAVRADFPWTRQKVWLAAAEFHPFSVHTMEAIDRYSRYRALGPGEDRQTFAPDQQTETKRLYASLINAKPDEIAFVLSTTDGENLVVAGMDLTRRGGNVVIDDLHFNASKYLYTMLQRDAGLELRVVHHRNWTTHVDDMDKAIDRNTRLVSMALVSNVNGFLQDAKAISDIAHARGAYVYADVIQAAGATPIDIKAMGIDFAASSTYKWLMGDFGFGFLYVRSDLQGTVVRQTRWGLRQVSEERSNFEFEVKPGAARYEGTSSLSNLSGLCAYEGLKYVTRLGVENIREHAKPLTDRLQKELPALGYPSITPMQNPTPIVSFLASDPETTQKKLEKAFGGERVVSSRKWEMTEGGTTKTVNGLRIGVSVYSNQEDVDRLLNALA